MDVSTEDSKQLQQLESSLLQADTRGSAEKLATLLAEEFIEYGYSGKIYNKSQTIKAVTSAPKDEVISLSDFDVRRLAKNLVLVTYRSEKRLTDGKVKLALRSSIWRQTRNGWRIIFHQGTPTDGQAAS